MPVTPADIYHVAERLNFGIQIKNTEESCLRTAAGRAYYAAFHSIRESLGSLKGVRDPSDVGQYNLSHQTLVSFVAGFGLADVEAVGETLRGLLQFRYVADYWIANKIDPRTVGFMVRDAQGIVRDQAKIKGRLAKKTPPRHEEPQYRPKS